MSADTRTVRLEQIADDMAEEGMYTQSFSVRAMIQERNALRLALQRAEIELGYCHSVMGNNRMFTRAIVLAKIKKALGDTQ